MDKKEYIKIGDLEIYKLARELSSIGWKIFSLLSWHDKKVIGDQFIRATDSVGANIAEGYSRYHYLDKIKFYYNARGSLGEGCEYWIELLLEREKISVDYYQEYKEISKTLLLKLNNYISSIYDAKSKNNLNKSP